MLAKAIAAVVNEQNATQALGEEQDDADGEAPGEDPDDVDAEADEVEQVQKLPPTAWPTTDDAATQFITQEKAAWSAAGDVLHRANAIVAWWVPRLDAMREECKTGDGRQRTARILKTLADVLPD